MKDNVRFIVQMLMWIIVLFTVVFNAGGRNKEFKFLQEACADMKKDVSLNTEFRIQRTAQWIELKDTIQEIKGDVKQLLSDR